MKALSYGELVNIVVRFRTKAFLQPLHCVQIFLFDLILASLLRVGTALLNRTRFFVVWSSRGSQAVVQLILTRVRSIYTSLLIRVCPLFSNVQLAKLYGFSVKVLKTNSSGVRSVLTNRFSEATSIRTASGSKFASWGTPASFETPKVFQPFLTPASFTRGFWYTLFISVKIYLRNALWTFRKTFGAGFFYLKGLIIVFFIDACLTDDEPLWEPIEWSLLQSWILFIFLFGWIGENLITSSYGSYTGRDKRVWFAWYKTFWLLELWYVISLGAAALFVIVPFYHELTYTTPFIVSWWTWYTRVFFCKFVTMYSLILYIAYFMQINIRFANWKKLFTCVIIINLFLSYLLYVHFFMSFFGYLTNPHWHLKNRLVDYVQLSQEPNRWNWGLNKPYKRDHFLHHRCTSLFWFKTDGPFASAFLFFHIFFFLCLFTLYIYWVTLMRRAYATQEFTYTFTTYCVSALKQFFYFFFLLYILIFFSFILNYWRMPIENTWILTPQSWFTHLCYLYVDSLKSLFNFLTFGCSANLFSTFL